MQAAWIALFGAALLACGGDSSTENSARAQAGQGGMPDDDFRGCPEGFSSVAPGLSVHDEHWTVDVLEARPAEPERYINDWIVQANSSDGTPAQDLQIVRGETFMPVHGHDGRVQPRMTALPEPGRFRVDRLNFTMRGPWEVRLWLRSGTAEEARIVFKVCVAK